VVVNTAQYVKCKRLVYSTFSVQCTVQRSIALLRTLILFMLTTLDLYPSVHTVQYSTRWKKYNQFSCDLWPTSFVCTRNQYLHKW
jgi:hypothetical protein